MYKYICVPTAAQIQRIAWVILAYNNLPHVHLPALQFLSETPTVYVAGVKASRRICRLLGS
jgi:hypothetical protein